jgi:phage major head subunit gpT-like protein
MGGVVACAHHETRRRWFKPVVLSVSEKREVKKPSLYAESSKLLSFVQMFEHCQSYLGTRFRVHDFSAMRQVRVGNNRELPVAFGEIIYSPFLQRALAAFFDS